MRTIGSISKILTPFFGKGDGDEDGGRGDHAGLEGEESRKHGRKDGAARDVLKRGDRHHDQKLGHDADEPGLGVCRDHRGHGLRQRISGHLPLPSPYPEILTIF